MDYFVLSEALPSPGQVIDFKHIIRSQALYEDAVVPIDIETIFGLLMHLSQMIEWVLKMYAPMIHAYYYKGRHLGVESSPFGIVALNLYFSFSAVVAASFFAINGGYAEFHSIYWCFVFPTRAKCDRIVPLATGGTTLDLDF